MSRAWFSRSRWSEGSRAAGPLGPAAGALLLLAATLLPGVRVHRMLVVANETVGGEALRDEIRRRAARYEAVEVLVVSPALNSRLRRWFSDEDGARVKAQARLVSSLTTLADDGIVAVGEIGDADPVQAIEDALCTFRADELIISTHPAGRSNWLERHVVRRAFERFRLPITHVIVDLEAEKAAREGRTGQRSA